MKYKIVVCGGTFDHLHEGHKEFLRFALSMGEKVLIGLTSDNYVKTKIKKESIEKYDIRKKELKNFLKNENSLERAEIEIIEDIYIPKIWQKIPIQAIIVTENNVFAAKKINIKRKEQGKYPLVIESLKMKRCEDKGYISSSKIRNGTINREGELYIRPEWLKHDLIADNKLRKQLKNPFGKLFVNFEDIKINSTPYLITVGDITTRNSNNSGFSQDISAIDFKVARKEMFRSLRELGFSGNEKVIKIFNPPGTITAGLFKTVIDFFQSVKKDKKVIILVNGEEDLSALVFVLASPLDSVILYGQPGRGVVEVRVTEKNKKIARNYVNQFNTQSTRGH